MDTFTKTAPLSIRILSYISCCGRIITGCGNGIRKVYWWYAQQVPPLWWMGGMDYCTDRDLSFHLLLLWHLEHFNKIEWQNKIVYSDVECIRVSLLSRIPNPTAGFESNT